MPIDTGKLEEFDPTEVPRVQELLREIDAWKSEDEPSSSSGGGADGNGNGKTLADWEKTSLKPYVEYFRSFVLALMRDERDPKIKREREEGEGLDF